MFLLIGTYEFDFYKHKVNISFIHNFKITLRCSNFLECLLIIYLSPLFFKASFTIYLHNLIQHNI